MNDETKRQPARCPQCDHAEHVGKCLQALRVGKPGEDQFCLCEPTRGDEAHDTGICHIHGCFYSGYVECPACRRIKDLSDDPPAPPTAQARPVTREQVQKMIGSWIESKDTVENSLIASLRQLGIEVTE